jgi:predicted membrane chloride channel (bestrophin family)
MDTLMRPSDIPKVWNSQNPKAEMKELMGRYLRSEKKKEQNSHFFNSDDKL